jgi:glycyl-tRNA synthetase alpha chain
MEHGLVRPSYDYMIKCSHAFNLLDARNAISVSQRQSYIKSIREMAKAVAEAYVAKERDTDE